MFEESRKWCEDCTYSVDCQCNSCIYGCIRSVDCQCSFCIDDCLRKRNKRENQAEVVLDDHAMAELKVGNNSEINSEFEDQVFDECPQLVKSETLVELHSIQNTNTMEAEILNLHPDSRLYVLAVEDTGQFFWACFNRVALGVYSFNQVLRFGYSNGFPLLSVNDASDVCELFAMTTTHKVFADMSGSYKYANSFDLGSTSRYIESQSDILIINRVTLIHKIEFLQLPFDPGTESKLVERLAEYKDVDIVFVYYNDYVICTLFQEMLLKNKNSYATIKSGFVGLNKLEDEKKESAEVRDRRGLRRHQIMRWMAISWAIEFDSLVVVVHFKNWEMDCRLISLGQYMEPLPIVVALRELIRVYCLSNERMKALIYELGSLFLMIQRGAIADSLSWMQSYTVKLMFSGMVEGAKQKFKFSKDFSDHFMPVIWFLHYVAAYPHAFELSWLVLVFNKGKIPRAYVRKIYVFCLESDNFDVSVLGSKGVEFEGMPSWGKFEWSRINVETMHEHQIAQVLHVNFALKAQPVAIYREDTKRVEAQVGTCRVEKILGMIKESRSESKTSAFARSMVWDQGKRDEEVNFIEEFMNIDSMKNAEREEMRKSLTLISTLSDIAQQVFDQVFHLNKSFLSMTYLINLNTNSIKYILSCVVLVATVFIPPALNISPKQNFEIVNLANEITTDTFVRDCWVKMYVTDELIYFALQMCVKGFKRNNIKSVLFWNVVLTGCCKMGWASKASVLFEEISESNAGSFNTLLCGLMSNGRLYKAINFSGGMVKKIFCTAMIHGLIVNELHQTDLGLLFKMVEAGMKPNDLTVVIAFSARIKAGALETGRKIHDNIFNKGLYLIATVDNALLDIYAKCNGMMSTNLIFIGLTENHICSWCVIILIGLEAKGYTLVIFVTLAAKSMEFVSKGKILHVPFDPGGSYLGATEYPYHYTTRMKSDRYLSALKRASVKNL